MTPMSPPSERDSRGQPDRQRAGGRGRDMGREESAAEPTTRRGRVGRAIRITADGREQLGLGTPPIQP